MWIKRGWKIYRLKRKQMGMIYYFPIVIALFAMPAGFLCFLRPKAGIYTRETYQKLLDITQTVIPFLSVFWLLFQLEEWLEKRKQELYDSIYKRPIRIGVFYSLYFNLLLLPSYLLYHYYLQGYFYEYFRILCVCAFFQGAVLLLLYITRSKIITVLAVFLYTVFSIGAGKNGCFSYVVELPKNCFRDYFHSGIFLIMGIGLFGITVLLSKKTK